MFITGSPDGRQECLHCGKPLNSGNVSPLRSVCRACAVLKNVEDAADTKEVRSPSDFSISRLTSESTPKQGSSPRSIKDDFRNSPFSSPEYLRSPPFSTHKSMTSPPAFFHPMMSPLHAGSFLPNSVQHLQTKVISPYRPFFITSPSTDSINAMHTRSPHGLFYNSGRTFVSDALHGNPRWPDVATH